MHVPVNDLVVALRKSTNDKRYNDLIALSLAYAAPVYPLNKNTSGEGTVYYNTYVLPKVKVIINELIERQLIDVTEILKNTRTWWAERNTLISEPLFTGTVDLSKYNETDKVATKAMIELLKPLF